MGNKGSTLKKKTIKELVSTTHFTEEEVKLLYEHFKKISSSEEDDDVIDKKEFQLAVGFKESLFMDQMFQLFDNNHDGAITFTEFLTGLSILCTKGTMDEKLAFSFRIYDFDKDGLISKGELRRMLSASLLENDLKMSEENITALVEATFQEGDLDKDDHINFEEYRQLVSNHPSMLSQMTINVSGLIQTHKQKMQQAGGQAEVSGTAAAGES